MSRDEDKLIRQLSLLSFLLSRPRMCSAREVQESVEGYAEMSEETFARRFHADRADLSKIGIEIRVLTAAEGAATDAAQLYYLKPDDFRLPEIEFSPAERKALSLALAALEGRFAYARPMRLALTAILRDREDSLPDELGQLPVAFAPDEDARLAGRQLARLEDAVSRGKSVCFAYPTGPDETLSDRSVDPYSIFLIQGHWYLVGRDHLRDALRTFRVGRIKGTVRFPTERPRDFTVPPDYDPDQYRARPPWLIGSVVDTATVEVTEHLAWWVKRLAPHVTAIAENGGCTTFAIPYADEFLLLSWVAGLGGYAQVLAPSALRVKATEALLAVARAHEGSPAQDTTLMPHDSPGQSEPAQAKVNTSRGHGNEPIAPEHLARTISLLSYLLDERSPDLVPWQALKDDLGLTRAEVEADLDLINLVNFGGGTYALTAEATDDGVAVIREAMADVFSQPARLSPAMARALLLALDLIGDTVAVEGLDSLTSVREKVAGLIGESSQWSTVIVDEMMPPDPNIIAVLNQAIREHGIVQLNYFTTSRGELSERLVEPYLLFHSADGWYVEAYCQKADAQRTFKLERISDARATGRPFAPRPEMDISKQLAGGTAREGSEAWALVVFRPRWSTYLRERGTKCAGREDGSVEARVPYLDESWIVQEVIRYLGEAVLEFPASARDRIRESASALAARYGAPHGAPAPSGDKA